ncbi:MAG: glycosyltransferase family 39 protein [Candidatus Liptonbacteria bacterium]|nr:glycosyltransferase family 39 protein [Candidatus Liptonbacteria bacterium]
MLLGALLFASGSLLYYGAANDSAIMDELAHIPAGYSYVKYLDDRLNPEHPPLLKALSALPLLALDLTFPTDKPSWQSDVNGQWTAGTQFLYESGNDAHKVVLWSRLAPIAITLLLVLLIYLLAAQLVGRWWALLPAIFTALSPSFLAHGHYVTTDVAAAFGVFIATWSFVAFLYKPKTNRLLLAGACFGIAQLLKFSAVLLVPYFFLLVFVFYAAGVWRDWHAVSPLTRISTFFIRGIRLLFRTLAVMAAGGVLIYGVYAVVGVNYPAERQLSDTTAILESYAGGPAPEGAACRLARCPADLVIRMAKSETLRPLAQYLLGVLMVIQRSAGGNTGYFLGEVSSIGSWYYFPVTYALKEPLAVLIFVALGTFLGIAGAIRAIARRTTRFSDYLAINFYEFAMLLFVLIYWTWSVRSNLNIGVRHILPTLPFIYILATGAVKRWLEREAVSPRTLLVQFLLKLRAFFVISLKSLALAGIVIAFLIEVAAAWPFYLSYYNRLGGGVQNGYRFAVDSNYDWGQDMYRLRDWARDHNVPKIGVDYFGGGSPGYELGAAFVPWWSAKNDPREEDIEWLAVSINTIQSARGTTAPGFVRKPEDEYRWLAAIQDPYQPYARAGTSIFIYKLK